MVRGLTAQCTTQWLPWPGAALNGTVAGLTTLPNGDLVVGGYFTTAGTAGVNHIAQWDGAAWSPFSSGMSHPSGAHVYGLTTLPNGDLVAVGGFATAGGTPANHIARWNGSSWAPIGSGTNDWINVVATQPNGDLVVCGGFTTAGGVPANRIARWNGTAWSSLGTGMTGYVVALTTLPNGDLVAGGYFATAGGVPANCVARWNGTAWSPLGTGVSGSILADVQALTTLPNGDVVAGGSFTIAGGVPASRIARWDGTAWSPLGSGVNSHVQSLTTLPNGDVVAGGSFTIAGGVPANRIARWNGTAWSPFGVGMNGLPSVSVLAMTTLANGDVVTGGYFTTAGGNASPYLASLTTTCPATAVASGTGCAGTGGSMVLAATALPWLGGTYRSRCTGMAPSSLGVGVFGFAAQSTPLSTLHPAGGPGCDLLVAADVLTLAVPNAGAVNLQFVVPATPALVGAAFRNQVVQVELGPGAAITWLGSSNALVLTTGVF
ncbi:MAG: hypothetical protein WAT39_08625 [Planctomycetota bacterium]